MKDISKAMAARLLLNIPAAPRAKLLRNTSFNRQAGLDVGILRIASDELEFKKIRDLARKLGGEGTVVESETEDEMKWGVRVVDGSIEVFAGVGAEQQTAILPETQLLLADSENRLRKLRQIVADLGANGPIFDKWEGIVRERPLSDDELEELQQQFELSTYRFVRELAGKLNTGAPTAEDVLPSTRAYFEGMCGKVSGLSVDPDAYLRDELLEHRKELIRRDLVSGLFIVLPGSLRSDIYPGQLVENIPPDKVWDAISKLSLQDPFSLAGLLDICLHWPDDARFASLAKETLGKICAEKFETPAGVDIIEAYALFVKFSVAQMRRVEGAAALPPFWRRLCAFTHAGHIAHVFLSRAAKLDDLRDWIQKTIPPSDSVGQMADMRSEPMYWSVYVHRGQIRAEVLGQLFEVRHRHVSAGRPFPDDELLVNAVNNLPITLGPRPFHLPGPLQGHTRSMAPLDEDDGKHFDESIDQNHEGMWRAAAYISGLHPLPSATVEKLAKKISEYEATHPDQTKFNWLLLAGVCAASCRSAELAGAVSKRVLAAASEISRGQDLHELFLALLTASSVMGPVGWKENFDSSLRGFAFHIPRQYCDLLWQHLQWLRFSIPAEEWHFARAEALTMAGGA